MAENIRDTGWFKSSASGGANDDCVEVRFVEGQGIGVRDSKNPDDSISVPQRGWARLVGSLAR